MSKTGLVGSLMLGVAVKVLDALEKRKGGRIPPSRELLISSTDLVKLLRDEKARQKDLALALEEE